MKYFVTLGERHPAVRRWNELAHDKGILHGVAFTRQGDRFESEPMDDEAWEFLSMPNAEVVMLAEAG